MCVCMKGCNDQLCMYKVYSCSVHLRWVFVIYLLHTHTDVVVELLITSSMYVCVSVILVLSFLMINAIRMFPFV